MRSPRAVRARHRGDLDQASRFIRFSGDPMTQSKSKSSKSKSPSKSESKLESKKATTPVTSKKVAASMCLLRWCSRC